MTELTQDELTVLLIAVEGKSMIPIGRWEKPIVNLAEKGYLRRADEVNYFITDAGRTAAKRDDDANFKAVIDTRNSIVDAQERAKARAEEIAALLAELAKYSSATTGDDRLTALKKWAKIILERAKEQL